MKAPHIRKLDGEDGIQLLFACLLLLNSKKKKHLMKEITWYFPEEEGDYSTHSLEPTKENPSHPQFHLGL